MKAQIYSINGEKKSEVSLPHIFSSEIREDLIAKLVESEKFLLKQRYGPAWTAGRRHSASGIVRHSRHKWKGHYGKGISRAPRKIMYRSGAQFYWIGAEVSQARGGRSVHAPTGVHRVRKINKKEAEKAMGIGLASTFNDHLISKRYNGLHNVMSAVIENLPNKTGELIEVLKKIFGAGFEKALKVKKVRSGKGKKRGRRFKSNAGLLVIIGNSEKGKFKGVDVKSVGEIKVGDLYPLGRLSLYTKKALEEIENVY